MLQPTEDAIEKRLLIIGGTITPYREVQRDHDRRLEAFLERVSALERPAALVTRAPSAEPNDRPTLWFEPGHGLEPWASAAGASGRAYFPFKKAAGLQHRATQDSVRGLAEIVLEREAHTVGVEAELTTIDKVIDARWQLRDPKLFERFDLVALSTTYLPAMLLVPLLATLRIPPHVKVFVGGPGAYKVTNIALAKSRFDYVLRTEAEGRFGLMLRHALGEAVDLSGIPGLAWREHGELRTSTGAMAYVDMNDLPVPDYRRMAAEWGGRVIYESARGCPYRCEFCDYPFLMGNKKFRYKSAERILAEWTEMTTSMGVTDVLCLDSLFTFPPARVKELARLMIASGLNRRLRWGCYARANDLAERADAELLREGGCEYIYIGFESGSPEVLKFMNKMCTVDDNRRAIENCRDVGIMCVGLFIAGFPGETPEMFEQTRQFLKDTPPFLLSLVPWVPDTSEDSRVPIMEPDRIERYGIQIEERPQTRVELYRRTTYRAPLAVPWGSSWKHRGMDLQEALDLIGSVQQDIYDGRIRTLSEELFLPRLLDDPLTLFQRLGPTKAVDFYLGLTRAAVTPEGLSPADLARRAADFETWSHELGLCRAPQA